MLLDFLKIASNLKKIPRQGWIDKLSLEHPESVADHTFSMMVMGMVLSDLENYDTQKILKMILLHDLAEAVTGDLTPEQKPKNEKIKLEDFTIKGILSNLSEKLEKQYLEIWAEFQENQTRESKYVHQIDKLEMALQAMTYSKEINSLEKVTPFLESAKNELNDPNLLKLFEQIISK